MKDIFRWAIASILIVISVLLWNSTWAFLDYIDKHGKFWAFVCAPIFALLSAAAFAGLKDVKKPLEGNGTDGNQINAFFGSLGVFLAIHIVIVLLSNN